MISIGGFPTSALEERIEGFHRFTRSNATSNFKGLQRKQVLFWELLRSKLGMSA